MDSDSSAIIVPALFLKKEAILSKCGPLMECAMVSERYFPGTREELKECVDRGDCLLYKHKTITHVGERSDLSRSDTSTCTGSASGSRSRSCACGASPTGPRSRTSSCVTHRQRCCSTSGSWTMAATRSSISTIFAIWVGEETGSHAGYKFYIMTNAFAMDIAHYE